MTTNLCASCVSPLTVTLSPSSSTEDLPSSSTSTPLTVPDDVQLLACACHFHWQCLLEAYAAPQCPSCGVTLTTSAHNSSDNSGQVLCNIRNEGGEQYGTDILPTLKEEAYLKTHPRERRARAFLEFCREGDLEAVVGVVQDGEESETEMDEDGDAGENVDVMRYKDVLGGGQSTLHAAVEGGSKEVAWLLLLLASAYPLTMFPSELLAQAQSLGLQRGEQDGKIDVRALLDTHGRTAEQLAMGMGDVWAEWIGTGRLSL